MIDAILRDRRPPVQEREPEIALALAVTRHRAWERGLAQVLANLIDNAFKYSRHADPPRISITTTAAGDALRLDVADNGIGFDMKYHDRIFGLFNRLVRQEDFEGTGAGLAIVKKIVEKMNGRVWADSAPGAGTTVHVELPRGPEEV